MKYIIFMEILLTSLRVGHSDTSTDLNLVEELRQLKDVTRDLSIKSAEQNVKIEQQNVKIANQNEVIMEQNAKIADQNGLIMKYRMSNAVQENSVLQTQNNLLERALSFMQQSNDQRQELLSQIARLESLNDTITEISKNEPYQGKETPVIAFGASRLHSFTAKTYPDIVVFDNIQTNEGNCYNNGVFTAPVPGLYIFQWTILTEHGKAGDSYLVVNGQSRRQNACNSVAHGSFGFKSGSASVPLILRKGDRVWITPDRVGRRVHGADWSSFQGWLQNIVPM